MEEEKSKPPSLPDDTQLKELANRVAKNVVEFQQFVDDINETVNEPEKFSNTTEKTYYLMQSIMKSDLRKLSKLHKSLVDECSNLIENVGQSVMQNQSLAPNFTKATGYDLLWNPNGTGFCLSKVAGLSDSDSEDESMSRVKDDDVTIPEKISSLEKEVESLKQELKSATEKRRELKNLKEENMEDIRNYKTLTKREIKAMEVDLHGQIEFAKIIDVQMSQLLAEKLGNQPKHDAYMNEMNMKMKEYANEILELKSVHEKEEEIFKFVSEQLRDEIKEKSQKLAKETKNMEALIADKNEQNNLISKLESELFSVMVEDAGVESSIEVVEKIREELKVKMVELEKVVGKLMEVGSLVKDVEKIREVKVRLVELEKVVDKLMEEAISGGGKK